MGVPLAVLRGERTPGEAWSREDALLLQALELYERGVHARCGQHLLFSADPDAARRYETHTTTCQACAALDRAERAQDGKKPPPPGQVRWVAPDAAMYHAIENPLPAQHGDIIPA